MHESCCSTSPHLHLSFHEWPLCLRARGERCTVIVQENYRFTGIELQENFWHHSAFLWCPQINMLKVLRNRRWANMVRYLSTSHEQARHLDASTPEYGMNGVFRSRPSWGYTELLCYRLSCTAARLGLATGGTSRNWTSSTCAAFAKFSVSAGRTMCQTRRSFAGLSSLALKPCWTWHSWSLVRTCQSHGRQQTPKTTVPCWDLNWKTAQRRAEEVVQRCAEIDPQGLQHPSWRVASLGPGPAGLEGSYTQGHKALWEKPTTEPGW